MDEQRRRITPRAPVAPLRVRRGEITRGQARSKRRVRTGPARYLSLAVDRSLPEQRIVEAAQALPPGGAATGWAALRLYGVGFCEGRDAAGAALPVPLAIGTRGHLAEHSTYAAQRGLLPERDLGGEIFGIPVVTPLRAAFDAARLARSDDEAVVEVDKALSAGLVTHAELAADVVCRQGWKGVVRVRNALERCSDRVRSPQETRLRLFVEDVNRLAPLLVNATIVDRAGNVIGEVDLLHPGSGTIFEYDGSDHDRPSQRAWDAVKHDRLRALGLEIVRVSRGHLGQRQGLASRIDQAVARSLRGPGPRSWRVELRPLDRIGDASSSDAAPSYEELDAATRAWLAGADLPP